ncbi:hypothetical protein J31TS4_36160 [Paenibacillus sp. J31TS4]|uniref:GNAT family N-acetyltransferase n=1 Tax=Paenibacillus sp. J31TS4 TaxID=2807195 RepID=UPI001B10847A|nr:GNAT family N-acetyltransferase [Paenibacillus sp. J31TS4]GIP40336.1 hypothetical protein J31TS4_36160 [Paenibacillus sp. J31TS4]
MPSPEFVIKPMSEEDARAICTWRYEPPYDLYNWSPWEELLRREEEFADPAIREAQYRSVRAEGVLCGFVQYFPMSGNTRIGLGLHPDWRGKGYGAAFVRALAEEAARLQPAHSIDLEVLVWNERARAVYERAGFAVTDRYVRSTPTGPAEFYCMVYAGSPEDRRETRG